MEKRKKVLGPTYGKITFAVGYNKNFADFKKEFQDMEDFRNLPEAEREEALKEAHKIATKDNGNTSTASTASASAK